MPEISLRRTWAHHDPRLSAHLNLTVRDVPDELLVDAGRSRAVAGCRVLTVDGGHWMVDTYSPVGLGKVRVRSRGKVGFTLLAFLSYIYVQRLYLTIVRQAPTS